MAARKRWRIVVRTLCLATALIFAAGCPETPPEPGPDDAGVRAWVRQVMPIVWGRKPRSCVEVQVWADLVTETDRVLALETMMNQPEFVDHWTEILIDVLKVHKETDFSGQINPVQTNDCFGDPIWNGSDTTDLAAHVRLAEGLDSLAPNGPWNMTDLIRSSIALDNLSPIMLGNVFAMMHRSYNGNFSEQAKRNVVGRHFGEVYLQRQLDCLACHNGDWSMTDATSGWNRHGPIVGSFEQAIYGSSSGASHEDFHHVFRTNGYSPNSNSGPWGMTSCGNTVGETTEMLGTPYFGGPLQASANVEALENILRQGIIQLSNGLDRFVHPSLETACNFCAQSCAGVEPLDPMAADNADTVRSILTNTDPNGSNCGSCHGASMDLFFTGHSPEEEWYTHLIGTPAYESSLSRVEPGNSTNSFLLKKLDGSEGLMPPSGSGVPLTQTQINDVADWIDDLQPAHACASCPVLDCSGTARQVTPPEAFAFLTATRLFNAVRAEVIGSQLTVAHGFPRTFGQSLSLWIGSEVHFAPSGWSLRKLLIWELAGSNFNRLRPQLDPGDTPFDLSMIYDPWVWADPREDDYDPQAPETHHNAMSDAVVRYPTRTLLRSVADTLGWPAPRRLPTDDYPSKEFNLGLGQRFSNANPGFQTVDFAGLLAWENTLGACIAPDGQTDWFDQLRAKIEQFNVSATPELQMSQIAAVVKDRLFSYGSIQASEDVSTGEPSEQAVLEGLAGNPFTTTVSGANPQLTPEEVETAARRMCGALIGTPQYMLAGIAVDTACNETVAVCNPGEPCTYKDICLTFATDLPGDLEVICGNDHLDVVTPAIEPESPFCPDRICALIPWQIDEDCLRRPNIDCRIAPPMCDPRCLSGPECCGGVYSPYLTDVVHVWWTNEASVTRADGVIRWPAETKNHGEPLSKGDVLRYGDLLVVPPGATIDVDLGGGQRITTEGRVKHTRVVVISDEQALAIRKAAPRRPPISNNGVQWLLRYGWLAGGEGGRPATAASRGQTAGVEEATQAAHGAVVQRQVDQWRIRVRADERKSD